MTILQASDRQLLGDMGLSLGEEDYVKTIAGMGTVPHPETGAEDFIIWSPRDFRKALEHLPEEASSAAFHPFRDTWQNSLRESPARRVAIDGNQKEQAPDFSVILRILNHPAVGAASAFIMKSLPQADLRWQWPLRIGTFEKDMAALNLEQLSAVWPARKMAAVSILSRKDARCEILVMHTNVRESLKRILSLPFAVRAGHIVLTGPADIPWRERISHIDALLSETQAGALSLITCPAGETGAKLNRLITALSHNLSYDLALMEAFPRESAIHLADSKLLQAATLTAVTHDMSWKLEKMSPTAKMSIPDKVLRSANIDAKLAKRPPELAAFLRTRASDISFHSESRGATALTEIAAAECNARHKAVQSELPRFLQGDLLRFQEGESFLESRGFIAGCHYRLDLFIGPHGEGAITATEIFDENQLDWEKKHSYVLQVMFAEPDQWDEPLTGKLVLPQYGTSTKCPLLFTPTRRGPFSGRVTIHYHGRILQTALLKATVFDSQAALAAARDQEPLSFKVESEIRHSLGTLDERRRFDACIVLNKTAKGKPAATTGSADSAYIFSLDNVKKHLAAINNLLNHVAYDSQRYSSGLLKNAKLLYDLAWEGHWIYRNLVLNFVFKSSAAKALQDAEYLQIVSTRFDEPVPLEFVYDYPPPKQKANVCPYAPDALRKGKENICPKDCKTGAPEGEPHICPLGFWGLSRVIERHQIGATALQVDRAEAIVKSEPIGGRDILPLSGPTLIATSKEVSAAERSALERSVKASWKNEILSVKKWDEWLKAIAKKPVLLLALPHTAGTGSQISLEISGNTLLSGLIQNGYVKAKTKDKGPLVILFGCDTANVADTEAYTNHITVFRQADAPIVLGTVGTVLGKDAARVAARIVKQLVAISKDPTKRFGEILRDVKRHAVADSLMVALCLVAFGDADWRLQ